MNRAERRKVLKGVRPLFQFLHFRPVLFEGGSLAMSEPAAFMNRGAGLQAFFAFRESRADDTEDGDEFVMFEVGTTGPRGDVLYPERELVSVSVACDDPNCIAEHSSPATLQ